MDLNEQLKGWLVQQAQPGSFLDKAGLGLAQAGQTLAHDAGAGAAILNDPRNSWIGMNPLGKAAASGLGLVGMLGKNLATQPAIMKLTQMMPGMVEGSAPRVWRSFDADVAALAKLRGMPDSALGKLYADGIAKSQDAIDAGLLDQLGETGKRVDLFKKHIGAELSRRGLAPHPTPPYVFSEVEQALPFNQDLEQAILAHLGEGERGGLQLLPRDTP